MGMLGAQNQTFQQGQHVIFVPSELLPLLRLLQIPQLLLLLKPPTILAICNALAGVTTLFVAAATVAAAAT